MNILLDLIGATLIGGLILLMVMNLNIYSSQERFASDSNLDLQRNAKTLAEILNHDMRKIGYNYNGTSLIKADSNNISFYADIDRDGTIDIISYELSSTKEVINTPNPRDKILIRKVNNDVSKGPSLGITRLKFTYRDVNGNITNSLNDIDYIETEMWLESPYMVDEEYQFTYWEMTINPRNI